MTYLTKSAEAKLIKLEREYTAGYLTVAEYEAAKARIVADDYLDAHAE